MLVVVVVFAAVLVVFVRVIAVVLLVVLFVAELLVKPEAIVVLDVTTGLDVVVVAAIVVLAGVNSSTVLISVNMLSAVPFSSTICGLALTSTTSHTSPFGTAILLPSLEAIALQSNALDGVGAAVGWLVSIVV